VPALCFFPKGNLVHGVEGLDSILAGFEVQQGSNELLIEGKVEIHEVVYFLDGLIIVGLDEVSSHENLLQTVGEDEAGMVDGLDAEERKEVSGDFPGALLHDFKLLVVSYNVSDTSKTVWSAHHFLYYSLTLSLDATVIFLKDFLSLTLLFLLFASGLPVWPLLLIFALTV
jgi:hypothetical protein